MDGCKEEKLQKLKYLKNLNSVLDNKNTSKGCLWVKLKYERLADRNSNGEENNELILI